MFRKKDEHQHSWGKWIVVKIPEKSWEEFYIPYRSDKAHKIKQYQPLGSRGIRLCNTCQEEEVRDWEKFPPPVIHQLYGDKAEKARTK